MNINKIIKDTLVPLNLPVLYRKYSGDKDTYITFFTISNSDDDYSNDYEETEVFSLQIDLWTKRDPTELKKEIKKALKSKFYDITYQDLYEEDTKIYHIAFRCYYYNYFEEE